MCVLGVGEEQERNRRKQSHPRPSRQWAEENRQKRQRANEDDEANKQAYERSEYSKHNNQIRLLKIRNKIKIDVLSQMLLFNAYVPWSVTTRKVSTVNT